MAKRILIVDDSSTMLMSIRTALEMNGYTVDSAGDGVQALEKLKAGPKPDLLLTDINMPHMGGLELIQQVRTLPGLSFLPILTLTTESEAAKRDEAKKLGASGWLVKPVGSEDLIRVIRQVLPGA